MKVRVPALRPRLRVLAIAHAPRAFLRWCRPDDRELGLLGEELAARHLRAQGCRLLGRRLRTPHGELDLWIEERGARICVEVKTARAQSMLAPRRWSREGSREGPRGGSRALDLRWRPGLRCDAQRLRRLGSIARWLGGPGHAARVDLVEVFVDVEQRSVRVERHADVRATPRA